MNEAQPSPDALDARIDSALMRRFAPPASLETLAERARPSLAAPYAPWLVLVVSVAAAALLYFALRTPASVARPERASERPAELVAVGTPLVAEPTFCRLVGPLLEGQPEPGLVHSPDLERLYRDMDACQRDASAACGKDDLLAERMSVTYGQPLLLRPEAAGRLHGPFGSDEWPTATIVTGTSDDRTAVLVADRDATLACCVRMSLPENSNLQLFTTQVGDVVFTEITPLAEPHLLFLFE